MANKNSWLANLFKPRLKNKGFNDAVVMVGHENNFTRWGTEKLYSNLVLSAIRLKQRYFGVMEPRHIKYDAEGKGITDYESNIAKILRNPNHYQTPYDFLTQAYFMREKDGTCFILDDKYKTKGGYYYHLGLYILLPSQLPEVKEDDDGNLLWKFTFDGFNNYSGEVYFNWDEIIVWKKDIEDKQYTGGGRFTTNANNDVVNSLNSYRSIQESVAKAAQLGCTFDGMLKVNAYGGDDEDVKKIRDKFIEDIRSNRSGGLPVLDNGAEYVQIQRQLKFVDGSTMAEIKENLAIETGVTIDMLMGKMTKEEKMALNENHMKPAAISLAQAMTKVFFTRANEEVRIYPHRSQQMELGEVTELMKAAIASGIYMIDEWREMTGHEPLPNGEGKVRPRGFNNLDGGGATE